MAWRITLIILVTLVAMVVFGMWLARDEGQPVRGSMLRVLFSGETMGELEPCNCSGKMAGGLPARGGYLNTLTEEHLLLDIGCMGNGTRDFEMLRTEATLRAMREMGYHAANIGEHELWLGSSGLHRLIQFGVPLVSANVLDEDARPVTVPYILLECSGLKVAVTGVVESEGPIGDGLRVLPARETLARLVPELAGKAGVIIVLADLAEPAVRELAGEFPEIALILFRGRGNSHAPERVNRTVIASIYGEARYIGDLTLKWESRRQVTATGEAVLLDERFTHSTNVLTAGIDWYQQTVKGRTFDLSGQGPGWERIRGEQPPSGNHYVGSEVCKRCHAFQYEKWSANRHSYAMKDLQKVGYNWSPECVVCHVVGYGAGDGYVSMTKTPLLGRVGCEACHGRGHVLRMGDCKGVARRGDESTCRRCHTPKRHPDFNYEKQWTKINHKEKRQ